MKTLSAILAFGIATAAAMPKKIMVIGDSQSEEYRFEIPFTAPDSNPIEANVMNWIELLSEHRPTEVTFGEYRRTLASYPDVRNGGYEYNWSIPGAFAETWLDVLNSSIFDDQEFLTSNINLRTQIPEMDAVVIFIGGNDVRRIYGPLTRGMPPAGWPGTLIDEVDEIVTEIRREQSDIPIIIGTFPDVGGTEKTQGDHPDKAKRDVASAIVNQANDDLRTYAAGEGIEVFDVAAFTTALIDPAPYRIGNIEFMPFGHPENKPRNLLTKDGFHPSTATQAVIANDIMTALNDSEGWGLTLFTDQEILTDLLGIDPTLDDDYLTWITGFSPTNTSMLADPDGDGLENLGEYALGNNPLTPDMPKVQSDLSFNYTIDQSRRDFVRTTARSSDNLSDWFLVFSDPPFVLPRPFVRLEFSLPN